VEAAKALGGSFKVVTLAPKTVRETTQPLRERQMFSRLLQHPARKRSGSILSTPEPARGSQTNKEAGWEAQTSAKEAVTVI